LLVKKLKDVSGLFNGVSSENINPKRMKMSDKRGARRGRPLILIFMKYQKARLNPHCTEAHICSVRGEALGRASGEEISFVLCPFQGQRLPKSLHCHQSFLLVSHLQKLHEHLKINFLYLPTLIIEDIYMF
jgi:hypothetical protein